MIKFTEPENHIITSRSYKKIYWYTKTAEQGNAKAQSWLK